MTQTAAAKPQVMVELESFPAFVVEALNTWRLLQCLGFHVADLLLGYDAPGEGRSRTVTVSIVSRERPPFAIIVGTTRLHPRELGALWSLIVRTHQARRFDPVESEASFDLSEAWRHRRQLIDALLRAGFKLSPEAIAIA